MHLRYDEDLVESGALLCASGRCRSVPAPQITRFHRERERLYSILDPDERNAAFFRLHFQWFREWGLEKLLTGLIGEYSLLSSALAALVFRKARGKNEEGAELYVGMENARTAVVALRAERFRHDEELARFLRHELTHLHDMIDPAFGYEPDIAVTGLNATHQRLARERYRLLWDITIDGRLMQKGHLQPTARAGHQGGFDRAYAFWPDAKRHAVFDDLWNHVAPCHKRLLELATDPKGLSHAHEPLPGAACPLCGFPTFHWAEPCQPAGLVEAIRREFPAWAPEHGVCNRCAEVYEAGQKFAGALAPSV